MINCKKAIGITAIALIMVPLIAVAALYALADIKVKSEAASAILEKAAGKSEHSSTGEPEGVITANVWYTVMSRTPLEIVKTTNQGRIVWEVRE